jgi:HK97 family phage portal protein
MFIDNVVKRASLQNGDATLQGTSITQLFGGRPTGSGITVTRTNATTLSAVFRAISVRSGAIAASPLRARSRETNQVEEYPVFDKPHPLYTSFQWNQLVTVHLDTEGDHFSIINNGKGRGGEALKTLYPLDPKQVEVKFKYKASDPVMPVGRVYEVKGNDGKTYVYEQHQILHIPGLGFNGLRGMSVLTAAAESLGTNLAAELYAGKLYGSGSMMSGLLKTDKRLDEEQAKGIKNRWQARIAGLANAGEVAVLDSGVSFESMTINPQDAQFIQSRDFGVDEVARWFGVPTRYLMKSSSAASVKQQVEQDSIEFALHGLEPITRNIESTLDEFIPSHLKTDYDLSRFNRGDTKTRSGSYLLARKASYLSVNEIRDLEGYPQLDDELADDPFTPVEGGGAGQESGGEDMGGETADQGEGSDGEPGSDNT